MPVSEAQKRANEKYHKANVKQVAVRFYPADREPYEFVSAKEENMGAYIKELMRRDMESSAAN